MNLLPLARCAASHDNIVHRNDLHEIGYDDSAIKRMCRCGSLHRVARGVYSVGSPHVSFRGWCRVALHLAGPNAGIAGFAEMHLDGVIAYEPKVIQVISSRRAPRQLPSRIRHTYSRNITTSDLRLVDGIRVTTFSRALVSVAGERTADQLTKLMREARYRGVFCPDEMHAAIEQCKHAGNSAKLRSALSELGRGSNGSFSRGETTLWDLLHDVVPDERPLQNPDMYIEGQPTLPDLVWMGSLVVAEYDGAPHAYTDAQVNDRRRERRYRRQGFLVVRVTPEDLAENPEAIRTDVLNAIRHQREAIAAGIITPRPLADYARPKRT